MNNQEKKVLEYVKENFAATDVELNEQTIKAFALGLHSAGLTIQEKGLEEGNVSLLDTHQTLEQIINKKYEND